MGTGSLYKEDGLDCFQVPLPELCSNNSQSALNDNLSAKAEK